MCLTLIVGILYDLFGRRIFLSLNLFIGSICFFLIPRVSPSVTGYIICAVSAGLFTNMAGSAPLAIDIVVPDDLGKVNALV